MKFLMFEERNENEQFSPQLMWNHLKFTLKGGWGDFLLYLLFFLDFFFHV